MSDANAGDGVSQESGRKLFADKTDGEKPIGNRQAKRHRRRRSRRPKAAAASDQTTSEGHSTPLKGGDARRSPTAVQKQALISKDQANAGGASSAGQPDSASTGKSKKPSLPGTSKGKRSRRRRGGRRDGRQRESQGPTQAEGETSKKVETTQGAQPKHGRSASGQNDKHNRRRVKSADKAAAFLGKGKAEGGKGRAGRNGASDARGKGDGRQPMKQASATRVEHNAYAALDLGTNNCRLLVAVAQQPGRFRVIDAFSRIVRLGEGLAGSGRLSNAAMDRAVDALKMCADKLASRPVKGLRLIATEACRQAANGQEFLQRVEKEAGLRLEVVDRETEARLAVTGCTSLIDRRAKGVVLFDIGGGSSELALLDLRSCRRSEFAKSIVAWTSLPLGVVTLSENHGGGKHVTRAVFDDMVEDVSNRLAKFEGRDGLKEAGEEGEIHLLGTSGTVTTLAGIHLKLPRYDRRRVDGVWMASDDVDEMIEELVRMDFEQRVANPCIGRDRADLVLAGCAILVAIQKQWPCPRLRVADRGLREGLLTEMMNADNAWVRNPSRQPRWRS